MPVHGTHARVLLIFWMYGTAMGRNTAFVSGVEKRLDRKSVILPLGRSGKHSAGEAEMLTVAGFENVFNVLDGFEGDLDGNMRRNQVNAWRYRNLPGFLDGMSAWSPVYGLFPVLTFAASFGRVFSRPSFSASVRSPVSCRVFFFFPACMNDS